MATEWEYGGVHLSIDNYTIPPEKLSPTPSSVDGLDSETEFCLRFLGSEIVQDAGILLKLPQVAMATAQVLYQRYFFSKSFVRYVYEHYAMASIFLAAKIEECPRRIREVINVFQHIKQAREGQPFTPVLFDQHYANLKNHIIKAERRVLKELGFCVHGKHPHKLIIMYLKTLTLVGNQPLVQTSWNCMNDIFRTDVFVRYSPEAVACACIFLAARRLGIPLPRHPPWWEMFNVDEESVFEIALCLQRLYARQKPNVSTLELRLTELRKRQAEEKETAQAAILAARLTANKQTSDYGSGNPSLLTSVDQVSLASGLNTFKRISPDSEQVPPAKRDYKPEEPIQDGKSSTTTDSALAQAENHETKSISHKSVERRKPSAYSEVDTKSRKTNKHRNRSRSPISRRRHSKSRRRRHSSSTASYSSESPISRSPRPSSRKDGDTKSRRLDQRDSRKRRSLHSPIGDVKSRRSHHHNSRHRSRSLSHSPYSSVSSRSDRSPPPPMQPPPKASSSRNRSPPRNSTRVDYDRRPSSKPSSRHVNGYSSTSASSTAKHIPVLSTSKNRAR